MYNPTPLLVEHAADFVLQKCNRLFNRYDIGQFEKSGLHNHVDAATQAYFATEQQMDEMAEAIGMDPAEFDRWFEELEQADAAHADLIEAIIDPSKDISSQYQMSEVTLADGSKKTGLVIEGDGEVTIYPPDHTVEPIKVFSLDVKEVKPLAISQMREVGPVSDVKMMLDEPCRSRRPVVGTM